MALRALGIKRGEDEKSNETSRSEPGYRESVDDVLIDILMREEIKATIIWYFVGRTGESGA